jgi:hypothetical protein
MFRSFLHFLKSEVFPRWHGVVTGANLWLSLALGVTIAIVGHELSLGSARISDIYTAIMSYAAISMGFSLAGITIALALPDPYFAKFLCTHQITEGSKDSYSNLLFVFSWTAFVHWILLILALAWACLVPLDHPVLSPGSSLRHKVFIGIGSATLCYGVSQFLVTILTLSQLGDVYATYLKAKKPVEKCLLEREIPPGATEE